MSDLLYVLLGIGGFAVAFPAIWCGVVWLVGAMGWRRLAAHFPADEPPGASAAVRSFRYVSGTVGIANYSGTLFVSAEPEGLRLDVMPLFRVGHPPICIPWTEITSVQQKNALWARWYTFRIGTPHLTELRLPGRVVDDIRDAVGAMRDTMDEAEVGRGATAARTGTRS